MASRAGSSRSAARSCRSRRALYPALRRLEDRGLISSHWAVSENNRRARYYVLTRAGRLHLRVEAPAWLQFAQAATLVLRTAPSAV